MAEHYAGHPAVIGWQIDNEFGDRCYCDSCVRAFHIWLEARYGSLERLNAAWGTDFWSHIYTAWNEIPLPWSGSHTHNPGLALDYRRFMSDAYVDYQRLQIEILRQYDPGKFITHNFMGFGYPKLNYYDLAQDLDMVAWDNYPRFQGLRHASMLALAHDTMRGLKSANFWVMEEQSGPAGQTQLGKTPRPGEIPFWTWQAIAHGADAIVYFRWRTCRFGAEEYWHGILDHDGVPRRRYREVAKVGAQLQRAGDVIVGSRVKARAALLLSYDSRFGFQNQPLNSVFSYERVFESYYRALWNRNIGLDVVSPDADLSDYAIVIAPSVYILPEDVARRLREYVSAGGALVTSCRSGVMDEHNVVVNQTLPGPLSELCGVVVDEYDSLDSVDAVVLRAEGPLGDAQFMSGVWVDVLEPQGAEVIARYGSDYYAGQPAVTAHRFGEGLAVYVGTVPDVAFIDVLCRWLCEEFDVRAPLDVPDGVEVVERNSDAGRLLFLLNGAGGERVVDVGVGGEDLVSGDMVAGHVAIPSLGVVVLRA